MEIEIVQGPGNAAAKITLQDSESVVSEGGAMIAMTDTISVSTSTYSRSSGGVAAGVRRMLAGETFFINHYTASPAGEVWLAPTLSGDLKTIQLEQGELIVESGSFVGCESDVEIDVGWQGVKSIIAGEGFFWLKLKGAGQVILSSFGAMYPIHVNGEYVVDSGHIVAFEPSLTFSITKAGSSWISSFLGGEGFVCKFKGSGTVWCQSHYAKGFGRRLGKLLRPRRN